MSEFARHIYRAIGDYRQILRKHLSQADRMKKLEALGLKVRLEETSDAEFYCIAEKILRDIREMALQRPASYYSYTGVEQFGGHLKTYLAGFRLMPDGRVLNSGQLSSKAFLDAVQLLRLPAGRLDQQSLDKIMKCNEILAKYADKQRCLEYFKLLQQAHEALYPLLDRLFNEFKSQVIQQRGLSLDELMAQVA